MKGVNNNSLLTNIYGLSDPRTPELIRYIGKTDKYIDLRLAEHIREAIIGKKNKYTKKNNWLNKIIKEGFKPKVTLIAVVKKAFYKQRETHYIMLYKSLGADLTNTTLGGEGGSFRKGMKNSPETIAKLKEYYRVYGHPSKGRKLSQERIEQIKINNTGRKHTEEWKAMISKKLSGDKNPNYGGKSVSDHQRIVARKVMAVLTEKRNFKQSKLK